MNNKSRSYFNKGWNSVAEIDIEAIKSNLQYLLSRTPPGTMQMAVVKADAYGHGDAKVALAIEAEVDWIAVYQVREGIKLRKKGITKPILVFGTPTSDNSRFYKKFKLTATVSRPEHFDLLPAGVAYHLKFDSGMGRVGFLPSELKVVQAAMKRCPQIKYQGLMTHFASSEVPGSPIFDNQIQVFNEIVKYLGSDVIVHASNSGATVHQSDVAFNMIRSGTAMYGFDPNGKFNPMLKPAMTWISKITQVRWLPAGSGVSYNHSWHMPEDGYVGIVPVGYADGFNRLLSNRVKLSVNGTDYPQVGNVTMDQVIVYLGRDSVEIGTDAIVMGGGGEQSVYNWASILNTITYEVTCKIGNRVKRVYVNE
jgi:alanine racemase